MNEKTRLPGYYWVKYNGKWFIALWHPGHGWLNYTFKVKVPAEHPQITEINGCPPKTLLSFWEHGRV